MADLPEVKATEESTRDISESNKDNRQRLQKSLRAGLNNVRRSVDNLNFFSYRTSGTAKGWEAAPGAEGLALGR